MATTNPLKIGRGLDVGTGLVIAAQGNQQGITYKEFRNAYVSLPEENRAFLEMTGTPFIEVEGSIFAVGDDAVDLAFRTHAEIHRPMAKGFIHPSDTKAKPVLMAIFEALLGAPTATNEPCFYSVPADPLDAPNSGLFHTKLISEALLEMGYNPRPVIEGVSISYAEAKDDKFTALCFSFGAGMTNIALTYKSLPVFSFSIPKGGDWIDTKASAVSGVPTQDIMMLKEAGVIDLLTGKATSSDLTPQQLREVDAIVTHYEHLIREVVMAVKSYIEANPTRRINIPEVPVMLAGGTAKAVNFQGLFERTWKEINPPLNASRFCCADLIQHSVAKGCFFASQFIKP